MFLVEIAPHLGGLFWGTAQMTAQRSHPVSLVWGTLAARVRLDVLVQQFVRVQFGAVAGQEEPCDPVAPAAWKKIPETLAALLTPEAMGGCPVRLMFQDEARLGRRVRPQRCWAPEPLRPVIGNGYEREFV